MRALWGIIVLLWIVGDVPCMAQADTHTAEPSARFPASWYPPDSGVTSTEAPDTGVPYTAKLVMTSRYRNYKTGEITYGKNILIEIRDSAGRKREETEGPRPDIHGDVVMVHTITVIDPVSHCRFEWMEPWTGTGTPTASVGCMARTVQYEHSRTFVTEPKEERHDSFTERTEPLPPKTMEGFEAMGERVTRTRSDPRTSETKTWIIEMWYSPELKEMLLQRSVASPEGDPGTASSALTEIQRTEPDPVLFYPPARYTIQSGRQGASIESR